MPLAEQIRTALAPVKDPATGHPLSRARQVLDVQVDEDARSATLTLGLVSPGYPKTEALDQAARAALAPLNLSALTIEHALAVPAKPPRPDQVRMPTVKHVLAVAAGKGGVGKSTVSVNLAMALRDMGAAVGLMDADIYGPSLPKMLGEPEREIGHVDGDEGGIAPARYRGIPAISVEYFIEPGRAVVWRGPMIHKLLRQFVEDVRWGELDYLVVDLPPGTGDAQISLGQLVPLTGGVIVTTPQEVALLDVRKAIDMLGKLKVPVLGVVENMSSYRCPSCGHMERIFGVGGADRLSKEYDLTVLGQIPLDPAVGLAGEDGRPLLETAPDGEVATLFKDIAAQVTLAAAKQALEGPRRSASLRTVN